MNELAVESKFEEIEAQLQQFSQIADLTTKTTLDGSEFVPLDGGFKTLASTFFRERYMEKDADYPLVSTDVNFCINFTGDNLTATIPDSLAFPIGGTAVIIQSGTGFSIASGGSVTVVSPQSLTDTQHSIYLVRKKATDLFNITQIGAATGGGAVDSVNTQTGVVVLDADDIDDSSTTHKFATAAQLTKVDSIDTSANSISYNNELLFDNVLGVFHSEQIQDADIDLTLAASGNKIGSVLYKRILSNGINDFTFTSDFDIFYGIGDGDVLDAGWYEFYFLYKPNGKVTVSCTKPDEFIEELFWKTFVDTYEESGSSNLARNNVAEGWTASAHSIQEISSGQDATFEFEVENAGLASNDAKKAIGLNNISTNNSFDDIDFAIALSNRSGTNIPFATIFEKGVVKGTNLEDMVNGDVLKIQVLNDVVTYYLNDVLWYTSLQTPVYPLFVDTSLHGDDSKVTNPVITIL